MMTRVSLEEPPAPTKAMLLEASDQLAPGALMVPKTLMPPGASSATAPRVLSVAPLSIWIVPIEGVLVPEPLELAEPEPEPGV